MSILPKPLPHLSLSKLAFLVLTLNQTVSLNPLHAMEQAAPDLIHNNALRQNLENHNFSHNHFIEQQSTIPLYDIKQASSDRIHQMHQENIENFQTHQENLCNLQKSILLSISMTDNPSFSYWDLFYYPRSLFEILGNNYAEPGLVKFFLLFNACFSLIGRHTKRGC